ncbi:hypothetical protein [Palleronia pelagia]|uniref:hypothetical protein n=1 Tax=Palleronia pelagia TaxID=387096 RepID=UPI0011142D31|nr:hypothetical protein [Palleronia pelagia]
MLRDGRMADLIKLNRGDRPGIERPVWAKNYDCAQVTDFELAQPSLLRAWLRVGEWRGTGKAAELALTAFDAGSIMQDDKGRVSNAVEIPWQRVPGM